MVSIDGDDCFARGLYLYSDPSTVHRRTAIRALGSRFDISENEIVGVGRQSQVDTHHISGPVLIMDISRTRMHAH